MANRGEDISENTSLVSLIVTYSTLLHPWFDAVHFILRTSRIILCGVLRTFSRN